MLCVNCSSRDVSLAVSPPPGSFDGAQSLSSSRAPRSLSLTSVGEPLSLALGRCAGPSAQSLDSGTARSLSLTSEPDPLYPWTSAGVSVPAR